MSLASESSIMEKKMFSVFDFITVTGLILSYIFAKQSIIETGTLCPKSRMKYLFNSASSKIIIWDKFSFCNTPFE